MKYDQKIFPLLWIPQFSDEWEYVTECRNHYDLDIDGIKIEFLAVLGFYYVYFSMIVCLHNLSNSNRSVLYVIIYICLICVLIKFRDVTEWALIRNSPWLYHQGLQQFIQLETSFIPGWSCGYQVQWTFGAFPFVAHDQ